jgi:hypothetical protein
MPFDQTNFATEIDPEVREVLRKAKAAISNPHSWVKFLPEVAPFDPGYSMCAVMSCSFAGAGRDYHATHLAVRALERALPPGFSHVPTYNDHPDTTHADIMALFDRAGAA